MNSTTDHIESFKATMEEAGITPPDTIQHGGIRRFKTAEDKGNERSGWYIFTDAENLSYGAFGDWRKGVSETWTAVDPRMQDKETRQWYTEKRAELERKRKIEEHRRQTEAARRAWNVWKRAGEADPDHDYLYAKGVSAYGVRQNSSGLLVPVTDAENRLHGLQYITRDRKRFMPGTAKRGHFYALAPLVTDIVIVAEGYATAATVYEATRLPTVCAFDASNLEPVCRAINVMNWPPRIIVAGDNDRGTAGNPGRTAARKAAQAVGGRWVIPKFSAEEDGSDWNDYALLWGRDAVRQAIERVL